MCLGGRGCRVGVGNAVGLVRKWSLLSSLLDRTYFTGEFHLLKALFQERHLLHGDHPFLAVNSCPSSTRPRPLLFGVKSCSLHKLLILEVWAGAA